MLDVVGIKDYICQGTENFYDWNKGTAPIMTLWETCKAFMRGQLIAFKSSRDKRRELVRAKAMSMIRELEGELKWKVSKEGMAHLQLAHAELKLLDAHQIAREILYGKTSI